MVVNRVVQVTKEDKEKGSTGTARGQGCNSEEKALGRISSASRPQRLRSLITVHFGEMLTHQSGDVTIDPSIRSTALLFTLADILFHELALGYIDC